MDAADSVWVFGYGSLMWRPGFDFVRAVPARIVGFHRCLCVYSHHYRGTPEKPGLVFGLDRGGFCEGVAFEVARADWPATYAYLCEREKITDIYQEFYEPVMLRGQADAVQALTFVVNRDHAQYAGELSDDEIYRLIKQGKGTSGACHDYVQNTLNRLRQLGIHDDRLEHVGKLIG
jgi:cation transport protein ChaC